MTLSLDAFNLICMCVCERKCRHFKTAAHAISLLSNCYPSDLKAAVAVLLRHFEHSMSNSESAASASSSSLTKAAQQDFIRLKLHRTEASLAIVT